MPTCGVIGDDCDDGDDDVKIDAKKWTMGVEKVTCPVASLTPGSRAAFEWDVYWAANGDEEHDLGAVSLDDLKLPGPLTRVAQIGSHKEGTWVGENGLCHRILQPWDDQKLTLCIESDHNASILRTTVPDGDAFEPTIYTIRDSENQVLSGCFDTQNAYLQMGDSYIEIWRHGTDELIIVNCGDVQSIVGLRKVGQVRSRQQETQLIAQKLAAWKKDADAATSNQK